MTRLVVITLLIGLGCSGTAFAQSNAGERVSWGGIKAAYGAGARDVSVEKIVFPSPWPFEYECDPSINDTSAKIAMMEVGILVLMDCSNILVMSSTTSVGSGEIALVRANRPDGKQGAWLVDLLGRFTIQELIVTSLDVNALEVFNVSSGQIITSEEIDLAAADEGAQEHLAVYASMFPGEVGEDGFWGKVKDWWNDMSFCQQMVVVTGVVTCSTLGGIYAAGCGVGFTLVYAQC